TTDSILVCCQCLQSKAERATKSVSRSSKSRRYTTVGAEAGSIGRRPCSQSKGQIIDRHAATLGSPIRSISPISRDGTVQFRRRLGTATFHVRLVDRIELSAWFARSTLSPLAVTFSDIGHAASGRRVARSSKHL